MSERQGISTSELLRPRGLVTEAELSLMPASLKPSEALPWARISRSATDWGLKMHPKSKYPQLRTVNCWL